MAPLDFGARGCDVHKAHHWKTVTTFLAQLRNHRFWQQSFLTWIRFTKPCDLEKDSFAASLITSGISREMHGFVCLLQWTAPKNSISESCTWSFRPLFFPAWWRLEFRNHSPVPLMAVICLRNISHEWSITESEVSNVEKTCLFCTCSQTSSQCHPGHNNPVLVRCACLFPFNRVYHSILR